MEKGILGMPFKGLSQQVKNAWKLCQSKAVD
jgi:hypothetical protein